MARRRRIANLAAGEVRAGRDAILGELFELEAQARSRNRRARNCAVRDMATIIEQAVRHCIACAVDEGRAPRAPEVTIRTDDVAHAAYLSAGTLTSLAVSVSSTDGIKELCWQYNIDDPFDGRPALKEGAEAMLVSRHLRTHRMVDAAGNVAKWYLSLVEIVLLLFASLPHGEADFYLGRADYMRGDGREEEAAESYARAERLCAADISRGRGGAGAHMRRGLALAGLGRHKEAVASHDEAIAAEPRLALAHLNRGVALEKMRRAGKAVASYDEAIRLDPSLVRAHHSRARALADMGREEEALGAYDKAVGLGGPAGDAYTDKGDLCSRLGREEEALGAYDAAIGSDRYAARAHFGKGEVLYRAGRHGEAAECYDAAIEIEPRLAGAHAGRGKISYVAGRLDESLARYNEAIEIEPGLANAHAGRGDVLAAMGRVEDALGSYGRALQIDPAHGDAFLGRNLALAQRAKADGVRRPGESAS